MCHPFAVHLQAQGVRRRGGIGSVGRGCGCGGARARRCGDRHRSAGPVLSNARGLPPNPATAPLRTTCRIRQFVRTPSAGSLCCSVVPPGNEFGRVHAPIGQNGSVWFSCSSDLRPVPCRRTQGADQPGANEAGDALVLRVAVRKAELRVRADSAGGDPATARPQRLARCRGGGARIRFCGGGHEPEGEHTCCRTRGRGWFAQVGAVVRALPHERIRGGTGATGGARG